MARQPATNSPSDVVAQIRKKLGHCTLERAPTDYLDFGREDVNEVFGNAEFGCPFGSMMEISGLESQGKSAIAYFLAALAQNIGAPATILDFERSFTPAWASKRGMNPDNAIVIQPFSGNFAKEKEARVASAEELCEEAEACVEALANSGVKKQILIFDSIPAMLLRAEEEAGLSGSNMRTDQEIPKFMSRLLRRWGAKFERCNVLTVLINQLRQSPAARFTDPWYTPGGNAPRFYSGVRLRVRRVKGGKLVQGSKTIGIQGTITAVKNKVGGTENSKIGFKMLYRGGMEFVDANSLVKDAADE